MVDNYVVKTNSFISVLHLLSRVFNTVLQGCLTLLTKGV